MKLKKLQGTMGYLSFKVSKSYIYIQEQTHKVKMETERMLSGGIKTSKAGNEGRKREKEPVKHRPYIFLV